MAETQTITYGKPAYIEKAQQDLLTALNQYITDIPNLPEKQATGLSDTQKFAIEQLKTGLGQYDPTLTAAQDAFTSGVATAGTTIPDFLTQGQQYLSDAASMKFDPSSAGQYMNEYQKYVIDEINKQAGLADKKADDAATQRGAFGGDRAEVAKGQIEEARLGAVGKASQTAIDKALQMALGTFGQEQKSKQVAGQLAPYYTSASSKAQTDQIKSLLSGAQVGGGLASLASKLGLQDISALLGAGGLEQAAIKEAGDTEYQNILAAQNRPLQLYGAYSDAISGLPSNQGYQIQETYGSTSSPFQDILGAGATILGGSGIFSRDGGSMNKGIMALKHG
tara:strand:+ start:1172 stop:2182 length:1011 start_codon:yes stop_codon:yes gene_type:complete